MIEEKEQEMKTFRIHYLDPEALIKKSIDIPASDPEQARSSFRDNSIHKGCRITKVKRVHNE